jgi:hypothetical protein
MSTFLIIMYLLSLALGYAAALDGMTRTLWQSLRHSAMPSAFQHVLKPPWERKFLLVCCLASLLGIGYAFTKYGVAPGLGIAFCFIVAVKISGICLLHKMHTPFHLKLVLKAVQRRHLDYARSGDMARAMSMLVISDQLEVKLCAMTGAKLTAMVAAVDGKLEHLRVDGAKADNYFRSPRSQKEP